MKNLTLILFTLMAAFLILQGCNKNGLPPTNGQLAASSLNVEINQPDSLKLTGAASTDSVKWSITPAGFDSLVTKNNAALVFFKKAGAYTVTATDKGVPASIIIKVNDSVYHARQQYVNIPLTGGVDTIKPYYYRSQTSDSTDVYFIVTTGNSYCYSSKLNIADSVSNNKYALSFLSVTEPAPCTFGSNPASAVIHFKYAPVTLTNGTYPLTITLNGTTYTGSFAVTPTGISFNWSYTSGVIISPLQIQPVPYNE